jgi:hypothetical protein
MDPQDKPPTYEPKVAPDNGHTPGTAQERIAAYLVSRNNKVLPDTLNATNPSLDEMVRPECSIDLGEMRRLVTLFSSRVDNAEQVMRVVLSSMGIFPSWDQWTREFYHRVFLKTVETMSDEEHVLELLGAFLPAMRKSWSPQKAFNALVALVVMRTIYDICIPVNTIALLTDDGNDDLEKARGEIAKLQTQLDQANTMISKAGECRNIAQVRKLVSETAD